MPSTKHPTSVPREDAATEWTHRVHIVVGLITIVIATVATFLAEGASLKLLIIILEVNSLFVIYLLGKGASGIDLFRNKIIDMESTQLQMHEKIINLTGELKTFGTIGKLYGAMSALQVMPTLYAVANDDVEQLDAKLNGLLQGKLIIESSSPSRQLKRIFLPFMTALHENDSYSTISTVEFWSTNNAGIDAVLIEANKRAASRRAKIRRVFILRAEYGQLGDAEKSILKRHHEITSDSNGFIETKCFVSQTPLDYMTDVKSFRDFAIWTTKKEGSIVLSMEYEKSADPLGWKFSTVHLLKDDESRSEYESNFNNLFNLKETKSILEIVK